ncbi:MAG TPA: hypothetical protein DDW50_10815 [Firmicutes bacterium]|nr:hypothetical protein [Bacillota bacterium]
MKIISNRWIFLLILVIIIQISATLPDYQLVFEDQHYLTDGILQVLTTDLDNDTHDDFILVGKNDISREFFIYWLKMNPENKPVIQWQSPNLFEAHSSIWATAGKFTGSANQLLVLSNSQYYLYQIENNHVNLNKQSSHNLKPLAVTNGDLDGDGQDELVIAKASKITSQIYNCVVQIWKFKGDQPVLLTESDLIGNIRGMTVGDLDQTGTMALFVEEGPKFAPGNIHVLKYNDQKLTEIYTLKKATKGPAYGMQIKNFSGEKRLVVATAPGFIDFFRWDQVAHAMLPVAGEINLKRDLMSMAVIDADQNSHPELIVAAYPQDFLILAKQTNQSEKND